MTLAGPFVILPTVMLDQRILLGDEGLAAVEKALSDRGVEFDLASLKELVEKRRSMKAELDEQKNRLNKGSKEVGRLMGEGKKEEAGNIKREMKSLSDQIAGSDESIRGLDAKIRERMLYLPNIPDQSVPSGADESENVEVRKWGEPSEFDFEPKDHVELGRTLDLFDFERAAKIAGSRFVMLKGMASRLERALMSFFLDLHTGEHGYTEVMPPFLANRDTLIGSGNLPKFEDDLFRTEPFGYYLVPTAEVPLTSMFRDEKLMEDDLPAKFCAYTPCFRSEAGAAGKDTRGLIRQHQFNKVELYKFTTPGQSDQEHEALTSDAETALQMLELPYRVVILCTGDMGFAAARTYDLEVWLPGQNRYREISSCSNCRDFQARRANIRYRPKSRKKGTELVHTINGSGLAVGRTLVAVLENFQRADGRVDVPEALRGYMKTDTIG